MAWLIERNRCVIEQWRGFRHGLVGIAAAWRKLSQSRPQCTGVTSHIQTARKSGISFLTRWRNVHGKRRKCGVDVWAVTVCAIQTTLDAKVSRCALGDLGELSSEKTAHETVLFMYNHAVQCSFQVQIYIAHRSYRLAYMTMYTVGQNHKKQPLIIRPSMAAAVLHAVYFILNPHASSNAYRECSVL